VSRSATYRAALTRSNTSGVRYSAEPSIVSPELAMGERTIDAPGAVTYEMLAGDAPFTGSSVQAIVANVISSEPERLLVVRKTVPPRIEAAVLTGTVR